MDPNAVFVLSIAGLIGLGILFVSATARRKDEVRAISAAAGGARGERSRSELVLAGVDAAARPTGRDVERTAALERKRSRGHVPEARRPGPVALPPDEEALGVTRRQVLNRGIVATMALAITGFGASLLAMLWPTLSGGFGAKIRVGRLDEILQEISSKKEAFYYAAGRFYINPYPTEAIPAAKEVTSYGAVLPGYEQGVVALYQKCVHLGCRVPWCKTSQWFECPCHGSQYNRVGEKKGGPAPRGLDRFIVSVEAGGMVVVDTSEIITGPPIGTNTTGQEAEGPHCVGAGGEG